MKKKLEYFGIVKDIEYLKLTKDEKTEKLKELKLASFIIKYNVVTDETSTYRDEFHRSILLKSDIKNSSFKINKDVLIEIRNFLVEKYSQTLQSSLSKFLFEFHSKIYALDKISEREIAIKYFKDLADEFKYIITPNHSNINRNISYLNSIAVFRDSNLIFIKNNQEIIDNYLIGNANYFSKTLINNKIFDDFFNIETTFIKLLELNKNYNFDSFNLEKYNLEKFIDKHNKYKKLFVSLESFLFLNDFIFNNTPIKSELISMVVFLKENELIENNLELMKSFLLDYYGIEISRIRMSQTNYEHLERLKLYGNNWENFNKI